MANSSNLPLKYPALWPPPEMPPLQRNRFSGVPIIGNIFHWLAWQRHCVDHKVKVLAPIHDEIVNQLKARSPLGPWPGSTVQQQVAAVISAAVRVEKELESLPDLHPDDPFPLLFWGDDDDLTPLIVKLELREKFRFELSLDDVMRAWEGRWTIRQFIEYCESCIQMNKPNQSVNLTRSRWWFKVLSSIAGKLP